MKTRLFILLTLLIMSIAVSAEVIWRDGSSASNVNYDASNDQVYGTRPANLYITAEQYLDGEVSGNSSGGGRAFGLGDTPTENPGDPLGDPYTPPVGDAVPTLMVLMIGFVILKFRRQIAAFIKR